LGGAADTGFSAALACVFVSFFCWGSTAAFFAAAWGGALALGAAVFWNKLLAVKIRNDCWH
jgi:hypothetical protein